MFISRNRFFPKRSERLLKRLKNNSLVMGEEPAEIPAWDDKETLELYWYLIDFSVLCKGH